MIAEASYYAGCVLMTARLIRYKNSPLFVTRTVVDDVLAGEDDNAGMSRLPAPCDGCVSQEQGGTK